METREAPEEEAGIAELLAGLDVSGPPGLAFVRRAPTGVPAGGGNLLCLSASFNPLTMAHLRLIQEAGRVVPPDEILLVLAKANVDKAVAGFPLARRLLMLRRFAGSRPSLSVAAASHGRFLDKVEAILPHYPAETRLHLILGFDTLIRLFDPKYYRDPQAALARLFGKSRVIVANRDPEPPEAVEAFLARPVARPYASRIRAIRLPAEFAAISATDVRAHLARGQPVTGLVPPEILPLLSPAHPS